MAFLDLFEAFLSHGAIFILWFIVGLSSYYFLKKWTMGSVRTSVSGATEVKPDEKKKLVPFLRSCEKETSQPIHGKITGKIPEWLQGTLLRNGPGLMELGGDKYQHVFDGLAMLHRFSVKDGMATYQNAFLRSDDYKKNMKANRIVCASFGTAAFPDPCKTLYQRLMSHFKTVLSESDNDNIHILKIGDQFYAATETNLIRRVEPETLETKEKVDISKFVAVNTATAHAHYDSDGTAVNVGSSFTSGRPKYCIIKFPPNEGGQSSFDLASVLCCIPSRRAFYPSYFHSFAMSTNYCVFIEQSLVISLPKFGWSLFTSSTYGGALQWCPEQMVYFHVVRKDTGEILPITLVAEAFMVFHQINAFEEDDHLVVDMCCYKDGDVVTSLYVSALEESANDPMKAVYNTLESEPRRYIIPLKGVDGFQTGSKVMTFKGSKASCVLQDDNSILCLPEVLIDGMAFVEMPRINYEKYNGKKYQYFYGICREKSDAGSDSLIKVDVVNRKSFVWKEENKIPSEPIFVASPNSSSEDDGVILSALLDRKDEKVVTLLINDAKTFQEIARADFTTSASVPNDFHGIFIS